jgi:hypothetical protein
LEATESAELDGDGAGEVVDAEVELGEVGQAAELARYLPAEVVVVQVEAGESREHGDGGRDGAGEPLPLERDGGDPAAGVAGDALEVVPAAAGVSASSSALREDEKDAAAAAAAVQRSRSGRRELLDAMAEAE